MSDMMRGPGWWLAADGKWYAPELRASAQEKLVSVEGAPRSQGPGWWLASEGRWYPPALRAETVARAAGQSAVQAAGQSAGSTAVHVDKHKIEHESPEASTLRRYMGFVPETGPEPEIRPELREPLRGAVSAADIASGASSDGIFEPLAGGDREHASDAGTPTAGPLASQSSRSDADESPGPSSAYRGPRHGRRKRRWIG
jgi:hypothetical protein